MTRHLVAERLATLGGTPDGRAETVAGSDPYPLNATHGTEHLSALADRFAALAIPHAMELKPLMQPIF